MQRESRDESEATPVLSPEEILRLLERNISDYAIFMLDPKGYVTSWNAGAERIKGYRAEEIIGRHFSAFYPEHDIVSGKPERELAIAAADGRVEDEGWRLRKDGTRFWANVVITALYDEAGRLRGFGKVTRDMTERRANEDRLRASEERFRLLVEGVSDYAIYMLDPTGHVMSWNAGAERIKGFHEQEVHGRHFSLFYPPEEIAAGRPERNLEKAVLDGRAEDEGWRLRKDGSRFWANVVITALYDERRRLRGFGKVTRDMTERRAAEESLSDRRRLLAHLIWAQESERRRIAQELSGGSLQTLAAITAQQRQLAEALPEPQAARLRELGAAAEEAVDRLRGLVGRLRPPGIERQSLAESVGDYLAAMAAVTGLKYSFEHRLNREPPPDAAVTIFRICQETLANVQKHAQASSVSVSITQTGSGVLTKISDDGIGLPEAEDEDADTRGFGVVEMRERAEAVGGWWTISRPREGGTLVQFWIPAAPTASLRLS